MFSISKRFAFSASHVLEGLPPNHPCGRLHGHNYEVEVVAERPEPDERGFVVDYRDLDAIAAFLASELDHRHLNDVLVGPTSAENLAWHIWEWCKANLPSDIAGALVAVRISETPRTWAEYRPGR